MNIANLISFLFIFALLGSIVSVVIKYNKKGYNSVGVPKAMLQSVGFICNSFEKYGDIKDQQLKKVSFLGVAHNTTITLEQPLIIQGTPYHIEQMRGEQGYEIDAPCPQLSPETKGAIDVVMTDAAFAALASSANVARTSTPTNGFSTNIYGFKNEELFTQTAPTANTSETPVSA